MVDLTRATPAIALYFYKLTSAGGAERMICQLADWAAESGFDVHLISLDQEVDRAFYPISEKVTWHKLGFRKGLRDKLRRVRALVRILRNHKIQSLTGFVISGDKTVFCAAKCAGVRLIAAERNAPSMYQIRYGRLHRFQAFALLRATDSIVVQQQGFIGGYPNSLRTRITTIANPVPRAKTQARPSTPNSKGRFELLCVSRLDNAQKGLQTLVRAFAKLADDCPDWDLRIVGDGPDKESLLSLIEHQNLTGRISIERSCEDVFSVYEKAHLFCIPSLWEGFPNALAEAMAHGLPAVGFEKASGVFELIGRGGWFAQGLDDSNSLASTLMLTMTSHEDRARRGAEAIKAMNQFESDKQLELWRSVFVG